MNKKLLAVVALGGALVGQQANAIGLKDRSTMTAVWKAIKAVALPTWQGSETTPAQKSHYKKANGVLSYTNKTNQTVSFKVVNGKVFALNNSNWQEVEKSALDGMKMKYDKPSATFGQQAVETDITFDGVVNDYNALNVAWIGEQAVVAESGSAKKYDDKTGDFEVVDVAEKTITSEEKGRAMLEQYAKDLKAHKDNDKDNAAPYLGDRLAGAQLAGGQMYSNAQKVVGWAGAVAIGYKVVSKMTNDRDEDEDDDEEGEE